MDIIESVEQLAADVMLRRERRSGSHPCGRISHIHVVAMAISLRESQTIATASCFSSIRTKNIVNTKWWWRSWFMMMDHQYELLLLPTTVYADIHFASTQNQPQNPMNWTSPGSRRRSRPFMWKRSKAQEKMPVRRRQQGVEVDLKRLADERYDGSFFGRNEVTATLMLYLKTGPKTEIEMDKQIARQQGDKSNPCSGWFSNPHRSSNQMPWETRLEEQVCKRVFPYHSPLPCFARPHQKAATPQRGHLREGDEGIQMQHCSCSTWIFFTKCWSFKQPQIGGKWRDVLFFDALDTISWPAPRPRSEEAREEEPAAADLQEIYIYIMFGIRKKCFVDVSTINMFTVEF